MAEAAVENMPVKSEAGTSGKPLLGLAFLDNLAQMSMLRQLGLLVGLAASVAIGFAVVLWSQQPDYRPLYGSLSGMDANQVVEALSASGIDYTIEPNSGALLVKADDLARARMRLAAAGVAPTDNSVGFEILDREQGLGTSQFMEATRYRRGLEGELARTVASLNNVKAARVHLAMPKASVFVRDERKPSASVLVELYPGRALEPSQVMAIVNLVATSVPELDKGQVTVVDQKGNLLSDQQELSELTMAGKQFDYSRRLESLFTQRVHNILQPVLGNGRYKAEVSADVDFSAVESTSEMFNPDQPALRSEQQVNEQRTSSLPPQGLPGALSNQPPGAAAAPEQAKAQAAPPGPVQPGQPLLDANGAQITDPATGQPYAIQIGSVYNSTCYSGEWSTFNTVLNDVPSVQALITGGNPVPIEIGSPTYIQSGVKDAVYNAVPVNKTVAVPVVGKIVTGSSQPVVAIAAFRITGVVRINGKSYIQGHFTEGLKSAGLSAGSGGGQDLGAETGIPSILIQ